MEEVNITNIINSSISSFKRKISFASIEISGDNVDYSDLTMKTSDKFKFVFRDKMGRIVDYFTIQNPSNVDRYSKLLFPLIFMLANVFYWAYYMYFWDMLNCLHAMVFQKNKVMIQTVFEAKCAC